MKTCPYIALLVAVTFLVTGCATRPSVRPLDVRAALLASAQKSDADFPDGREVLLTHFSHVGQLVASNGDILYVADRRAVISGMLAPRGRNYIMFFDGRFQYLGKVGYVASRPLWCDGSRLYLFGDLDGFATGLSGNVIEAAGGYEHLRAYRAYTPLQPYQNDGQRVTYWGQVMPEADPATFHFISDVYSAYGKDAQHVFLQDKPIPGADPATFAVMAADRGEYGKDARHVYLGLQELSGADPRSFEVLAAGFEKDARHVYYQSSVLTNADSRSFALIAVNEGAKNVVVFAKDAAHVFFQGGWGQAAPSVIAGADPKTFVTLDHASYQAGFAKDAHRVYYGDEPLNGADPQSFESLAPFGKDAHAVYFKLGRMAGADPKTFTVLQIDTQFDGTDYAKDARSVYYGGQRIPGADPATFTAVTGNEPDRADAKDRHQRYLAGRVIKPGL